MGIYTKKGDTGSTKILNGKSIRKDSLVINLLGSMDETISFLGICITDSRNKILNVKLTKIQKLLFSFNAVFAGFDMDIDNGFVKEIEREIDVIDAKLPVLKNFILPGGSKTASNLYFLRTLIRKSERTAVTFFSSKKVNVSKQNKEFIQKTLNRMSDYVFMLARSENKRSKKRETIWKSD